MLLKHIHSKERFHLNKNEKSVEKNKFHSTTNFSTVIRMQVLQQ